MSGRATKSDNTNYNEVLGKAALKNHLDKGGDPEKFKERAHANRVLSDSYFGGSLYGGLDDLYNETTKKLSLSRNMLCSKC